MRYLLAYLPFSFLLMAGLSSFNIRSAETDLVSEILRETNAFRKDNGLPPLTLQADLSELARRHSENMAVGKVSFGHSGFSLRESQARKKVRDIRSFAENVAYGMLSGTEAVRSWKNSAGHRRNMLGSYRYIGIGIAYDRQGRIYFTQVFAG